MKPILIRLDLKTNNYSEIELKQGCQDTLIATITDGGEVCDLTGEVISIEMLKADETFIIQSTDISVKGNVITVKLNKDITRVSGKGKLQIRMTKDNVVSGSWVVDLRIKEGAIDNSIGESGNIVTIKEELDKSIVEAKVENDKTQDLIENGGAATKGQVAELSSQMEESVYLINSIAMIPTRIGAEVDYTQAIQRVIDLNKPCYIEHIMTISNTIVLKQNSVFIGKGRSGPKLTNTSDNFLFSYTSSEQDSPYDLSIGITLDSLNIETKNLIKINSRELDFNKIGALKGGTISNCKFNGRNNDPNDYTDIKPTLVELQSYGTAIQCTKCFDMSIRDSEIEYFGVAIDFLGCDINLIDNCRLSLNGRHFDDKRQGTFGSQNKIKNCDVMWNRRYGGIYLDGVFFTTLDDNYFECYKDSGTFIHVNGGIGQSIINNRFDDNTKPSIPMVVIDSKYGFNFSNNRYNESSTKSFVSILNSEYSPFYKRMGIVKNNDPQLKIVSQPLIERKDIVTNICDFNTGNIYSIGGEVTNSFPFEQYEGKWIVKQIDKNCLITLKPTIKTNKYKLITNSVETTGSFFINIRENNISGTIIYSGQIPKTGSLEVTTSADAIMVEFLPHQVKLLSMSILNVV